jgi:aldose 1-epimerase
MTGHTTGGLRRLVLDAADARLEVSPVDGGRISSLVVRGSELLVTEGAGPVLWGSFPMVPFAGRIRAGRFRFGGRDVQLGLNFPPNAIHGTVFERPWQVDDPATLSIDLGPGWPFDGRVVQRFELRDDGLEASLRLVAAEPMPGALGWHPWFRRRLTGAVGRPTEPSAPVEIHLDAASMYVRDADGLPTGELIEPTAGPWDDCFTGLRSPPRLTWPGVLGLEMTSSCDHWVVYDEPSDAVCVEPQTAPPDFVNLAPSITVPGEPLLATMTWRWWALD